MNFPTSIRILDSNYKVVYFDRIIDVDVHERDRLYGQVDYNENTVRLYRGSQDPAAVWQCLLHEAIHIVADKLHIKVDDTPLGCSEEAVDLLATGINSILQLNPWVQIPDGAAEPALVWSVQGEAKVEGIEAKVGSRTATSRTKVAGGPAKEGKVRKTRTAANSTVGTTGTQEAQQ